jgi:PST family polysaccharide transporter
VTDQTGWMERHVARGALLQQAAQVWGTLCMLAMITVLARQLGLAEFGVYGLFVSVAAYMLLIQLSVEGATIRAIAGARVHGDRERVFTTAVRLYAACGFVAAVLIAGLGILFAGVLGIPDELRDEARAGVLILAGLTAVGWPAKAFQDLLRGMQLFGAAALAEIVAYSVVCGGVIAMALVDAPLSLLIGLGGGLSATVGFWCFVSALAFHVPIPYRRAAADRATMRELAGVSSYLFLSALSDLFSYSLDRIVLAAYKGASAVGLYEGAVRPHNLLRVLHGTLVLTVTPVASSLRAEEDSWRSQQLLVRGTRYVLAVVAPVATVLTVLAGPVLEVWLGETYTDAAAALAILAAYWIVGGNAGVAGGILIAAGRVRALAIYSWVSAGASVLLAVSLTPSLGLEGVALAIAVPAVVLMPWFLHLALRETGVALAELARGAWLPAYTSCGILAAGLLALRAVLDPDSLLTVFAVAAGGLALVAALYWLVWFDDAERRLVRALAARPLAGRTIGSSRL